MRIFLIIIFITICFLEKSLADTIHIFRPYTFDGSLAPAKVTLNGYTQKIKTREYIRFSVNGRFTMKVDGAGLLGAAMRASTYNGNAGSNSDRFFLIGVKEGLGTHFTLKETSEDMFRFAREQSK